MVETENSDFLPVLSIIIIESTIRRCQCLFVVHGEELTARCVLAQTLLKDLKSYCNNIAISCLQVAKRL